MEVEARLFSYYLFYFLWRELSILSSENENLFEGLRSLGNYLRGLW
jgi:hypothetical protein